MKKLLVFVLIFITSVVMISCEGDFTIPSDITIPGETTNLETTDESTNDTSTTGNETTQSPTTDDMVTEEPTTVEETTTGVETTTESQTTLDRTEEISYLQLVMQNNGMEVSDQEAFATELYDMGMRSSDLETMMENTAPIGNIDDTMSMTEVYDVFDQVMEDMDRDMVKALLSALIKVELRYNLQEQLDYYNSLSSEVIYYDQDIKMLESMIELIDSSGDQVVDSAMVVVDYLMDVQAVLDSALIGQIEELAGKTSYTSIDYTVMVMVKDGIVTHLKNHLPSVDDIALMHSTLISFLDIMTDQGIDFDLLDIQAQAQEVHLMMEMGFDFILTIDQDYITALVQLSQNSNNPVNIEQFMIENINLMDEFLFTHADDFDAINSVFTQEEKVAFFDDFMIDEVLAYLIGQDLDQSKTDAIINVIHTYISFEDIQDIQGILGNGFNDLLDSIIANNYDVISDFIALSTMNPEDYDTLEAYNLAMNQATFAMIVDALDVVNPVIQNGTAQDFQTISEMVLSILMLQVEIEGIVMEIDMTDQITLMSLVGSAIINTSQNQFNIISNFVNLAATTSYLEDIYPIFISMMGQEPTQEQMYEFGILLANVIVDAHTLIETDLATIEAEIETLFADTSFVSLSGITQVEIDEINAIFDEMIPGLYTQADLINEYDYSNLTTEQAENVMIFLNIFFPQPTA